MQTDKDLSNVADNLQDHGKSGVSTTTTESTSQSQRGPVPMYQSARIPAANSKARRATVLIATVELLNSGTQSVSAADVVRYLGWGPKKFTHVVGMYLMSLVKEGVLEHVPENHNLIVYRRWLYRLPVEKKVAAVVAAPSSIKPPTKAQLMGRR